VAAFKRWYDFDQRLSVVVRAMEFMSTNSQCHFADKLLELSEALLVQRGGETYIEMLEPKKKTGLEKADASKGRWYDRQETLHKAFVNLYALPNEDRQEVAARMVTPIQIVEGYERYCRKERKEPDILVIEEVLRSCFVEGQDRARRLYALYLSDPSDFLPKRQAVWPPDESRGMWSSLLESIQTVLA
jgi:hypothetical protein